MEMITPNKNYSYPSNDLYLLSDFAFKIMDNYSSSFNFEIQMMIIEEKNQFYGIF